MNDHRRRDAGILQVTERDILALTWIAEQYCISYDHIQRLLAIYTPATTKQADRVARSTAQNAIERWLHMGYIDLPQKIIREHAAYLWLSRKGIKELGLPYAYYAPKPSTVKHFYAVNAIRLHMQSFHLSAQWMAQRTLRIQTKQYPLPDAHMELHTFPSIAIQIVEQPYLTIIALHDEITKLEALTKQYPRIRYFVHHNVIEILRNAIREKDVNILIDERIGEKVVWYGLDAKEHNGRSMQKLA